MRARLFHVAGGIIVLAGIATGLPSQEADEPIRTDVEERVEVRLTILDVVVLDRSGRTVPDLTPDEFEVTVNGRDVEIASVDLDCPIGAVDDPRAGKTIAEAPPPSPIPGLDPDPVRLVLVFDFSHIGQSGHRRLPILSGEVFAQVKDMVRLEEFPNEEIMVVSMGNGLRIATPFTSDRSEIQRSIDRVLNDPANFGGNFFHLTENAFFSQVKVLLDVLEAVPGRKAVVLFTGRLGNGFEYDPYFRELAALSATARVALYPVDTAGLEVEPMYRPEQAGGPKKLARMAVETGGRLTWNTNDLTLGYTRAQRDLACTYEIAFYDERPRLDRQRRVRVWLKRRGVHAYHASSYIFRSRENKRRSLITAAYMAPDMFGAGALQARVFPLRPRGSGKWETLVAIGFPITPEHFEGGHARWDLGGVIRKDTGTRIKTFSRRIEVDESGASGPQRSVSFLEPVALRPGRYQISVVLSSRTGDQPFALTADIELPQIPMHEPFLVGPILGRRAGADVVILGKGLDDPDRPEADQIRKKEAFEPLLTQSTESGVAVAALTQVCLVDPEGEPPVPIIHRELVAAGGAVVGTLPPVAVELERAGGARCGTLLDWVPTGDLPPGQYFLEARPASAPVSSLGSETVGARLEVRSGSR